MMKKTLTLSYKGLKNILPDMKFKEPFTFYIGKKALKVNRSVADFLSQKISQFHFLGENINSLFLDPKLFLQNISLNDEKAVKEEEIEERLFSILQQMIEGEEIKIEENELNYFYFLSHELKNDEILFKIQQLISYEITNNNWEKLFQQNSFLFKTTNILPQTFVDFFSESFHQISNKIIDKYLQQDLSIEMIESIISNEKLQLRNEDQLIDFIFKLKLSSKLSQHSNFHLILLLENVEFEMLSEESFQKFIQNFDYNDLTNKLWFKICSCFHPNHLISQHSFNSRYPIKAIPYHQETSNRFCGIIHRLTKECCDNVHDKGIVDVTSSSVYHVHYSQNAVDLENKTNYFHSDNIPNSWICYDFKEKRIQPTHYSIRSRHDCDKGGANLQAWVIE